MATYRKVTLKDGKTRWRFRFYAGRDADGKANIIQGTRDRKKDAEAEVTRLKRMRDLGGAVAPSREPLGTYLKTWLEDVKRQQVRERTFRGYKGLLRRWILDPPEEAPALGSIRLHRLRSQALQHLYGWMQRERGLSAASVRQLHAVIRQGLQHAARTGALASNPAALVQLPKIETDREPEAMTPEEAERFLAAAREEGPKYAAFFTLLLTGGLRPGEAVGLTWDDASLDAGKFRVHRSLVRQKGGGYKLTPPKTKRARRTVVLPAFAVEALRAWKAAQARERLKLGAEWADGGFIFTTGTGEPLDALAVYKGPFCRVMERAGLGEWRDVEEGDRVKATVKRFKPKYRQYSLRHTCATLLLRRGLNAKVVSERLGHAKVAFTMDVYSASLGDMQSEAAEELDALLGNGGAG